MIINKREKKHLENYEQKSKTISEENWNFSRFFSFVYKAPTAVFGLLFRFLT